MSNCLRDDLKRALGSKLKKAVGAETTEIMSGSRLFDERDGVQNVLEDNGDVTRHQNIRTASLSILSRSFG